LRRTNLIALAMVAVALLLSDPDVWLNPAAAQPDFARNHGALPLDAAAYAKSKRGAEAMAEASSGQSPGRLAVSESTGPVADPSFEGLPPSVNGAPPDPTGAIGPTRYIQITNLAYRIHDRAGASLGSGTLDFLTGHPSINLTDPQIIWDATTEHFYYLVADRVENTLAWGFSKTDSPVGGRDQWCRYTADFGYSAEFPDYPKLGDSEDFLLIGVNVFKNNGNTLGRFISADVAWISKPEPGPVTVCPSQGSFTLGTLRRLQNADGTPAFTPVPADQVDSSGTGYVVAAGEVYGKDSNFITVWDVTKNATTGAAQISSPKSLSVATFSMPADAPQKGTSKRLDTLDGRLEHAMAAVDPALGHVAVWTAHAVFGGAGSGERWYEIDPIGVTPSLFRSGAASSPSLFVWNGAISPDRAVSASGSGFGSNMVMGFNTSSAQEFPAIQMVSKIGAGPQSGFVLVKQSPGNNVDFTCQDACRWGDYSGAVPDPVADLTGATGKVWLTNEWNVASVNNKNIDWRTWIWGATP